MHLYGGYRQLRDCWQLVSGSYPLPLLVHLEDVKASFKAALADRFKECFFVNYFATACVDEDCIIHKVSK